jgi:hypothetical protein
MPRKLLAVFSVVIILLLVFAVAISLTNNSQPPQMPNKHPPMITQTFTLGSFPSVSQGSTFQINITIDSLLETELPLPFENLYIMAFNDSSADIPQGQLFTYSFSENPLLIPANGTNTSTLTITLADNASIGKYLFYLNYGNSNLTYVGGNSFIVNVASNVLPSAKILEVIPILGSYSTDGVTIQVPFYVRVVNTGLVDADSLSISVQNIGTTNVSMATYTAGTSIPLLKANQTYQTRIGLLVEIDHYQEAKSLVYQFTLCWNGTVINMKTSTYE